MRDIVKSLALFILVWHFFFSRHIWFYSFHIGKLSNPKFVRVQLLENFLLPPHYVSKSLLESFAFLETIFAFTYITSLILQILTIKKEKFHFFLTQVTLWSYFLIILFDINHVQPPVLNGIALLLVCSNWNERNDYHQRKTARFIMSGTWFWSGAHKINPSFLLKPNDFVDAILAFVFEQDIVKNKRVLLRFLVAVSETLFGVILIIQNYLDLRWKNLVKFSAIFFGTMHLIIISQLIHAKWNYSVIGWNISYFFLTFILFWPLNMQTSMNDAMKTKSKLNFFIVVFFVFLPFLLLIGYLDPYLGNSNYSHNLPILSIEFPVSSAYNKDVLRKWQKFENISDIGAYSALSFDKREIITTNFMTMHILATGSQGYSSEWAQAKFAQKLCNEFLDDHELVFNHEISCTGIELQQSLLQLIFSTKLNFRHKPKYYSAKCSKQKRTLEWKTVNASDGNKRMITFRIDDPYDLYWVDQRNESSIHLHKIDKRTSKSSWVGHRFVAAMTNHEGNLCIRESWIVSMIDCFQTFSLDNSSSQRTLPGYTTCNNTTVPNDN